MKCSNRIARLHGVFNQTDLLVPAAVLLPLLGLGGAVYVMQKQVIEERLQ